MKKMILAALVAVCSLSANAQVWLGGQVSFGVYHNDDADRNTTTFNITPEIGYSLNDSWDLAIRLGYDYSKKEDFDAAGAFVVEPYARWTFANSGPVGFFLDMGFGIKTGDFYSSVSGKSYADETAWTIGVRPGVKFAVSPKVTLVASTGYLGYTAVKDDYKLGFNVNGNALSFGFYYSL